MNEFGHVAISCPGVRIDGWGVGPFVITVSGRSYRFEDSDRFGPALIGKDGDPLSNPWPAERSPFWRAHRIWKRQGRRVAPDGVQCLWDEPKPMIVKKIGRTRFMIDGGDEDGKIVEVEAKDIAALETQGR